MTAVQEIHQVMSLTKSLQLAWISKQNDTISQGIEPYLSIEPSQI